MEAEDLVASALEVVDIAEVRALLARADSIFTETELAYARSKSDPERRLAARLAAKRAALRLLGTDLTPLEIEVWKGPAGPPRLKLSEGAKVRLRARGAARVLVSLTHGREHAAASVLLLRGTG